MQKDNMNKILIIAFQPYNNNMYPPLKVFIDLMKKQINTKYFLFHERGYSFEKLRYIIRISLWLYLIVDIYKLIMLLKKNDFSKIIVVDHFAFAILSFFANRKKIVFWSHDIISYDKKYYKNPIIKWILSRNKKLLKRDVLLLIQDEDRKNILERTLKVNIKPEQIFYMPVFLEDINDERKHRINSPVPVLMQCGGCGSYRFTDKLIKQYQIDNNYILFLHGYIFNEIKIQLNKIEKCPFISEERIDPKFIYTIIEKCNIGFVGYTDKELNFKYIAKASGQLVEFLKMGKPIISIGENNIGIFLEENKAGKEIKNISMLSETITSITSEYETYSKNALSCFKKYFDSNLYINKLIELLKR
jgi:hypothetical protein